MMLDKPEGTAAECEVHVQIHPYNYSLFNIFAAVLSPAFAE
jgi:hypothetical protein